MDIKELRKSTGLSQVKFAKKYGIPRRTVENWESGASTPPEYERALLARVIADEQVNHSAFVFSEYRDSAGIGSEKLFADLDDAIQYAKFEWEHMTDADRRSYIDDPCGQYCVADATVYWYDEDEKYCAEIDNRDIIWSMGQMTK